MVPVIVLCGSAGSGKSTVANIIAETVPNTEIIAFADPIKRLTHMVFGFDEDVLWGPSAKRNKVVNWSENPIFRYQAEEALYSTKVRKEAARLGLKPRHLENWLSFCFEGSFVSARRALQTLGTDIGRATNKNIWTDEAWWTAMELLGGDKGYSQTKGVYDAPGKMVDLVVIADGRFRNEILSVTTRGGEAWRITRDTGSSDSHSSETEIETIPGHFFNDTINNYGSLEELHHETYNCLHWMREGWV